MYTSRSGNETAFEMTRDHGWSWLEFPGFILLLIIIIIYVNLHCDMFENGVDMVFIF